LLVIGNITLDSVFTVDRLPRSGKTAIVRQSREYFGGRGANIAVLAAELGLKVSLLAAVGDDLPRRYSRHLRARKVGLSYLRHVKGSHCARFLAFQTDEKEMVCFLDPIETPRGVHLLPSYDELNRFQAVMITPLDSDVHLRKFHPSSKDQIVFLALGEEIYRKDRRFLHQALSFPHYLFLNELEFAKCGELVGKKGKKFSPKVFFALGPRLRAIVVTKGEKGCIAHTRSGSITVPAVRTPLRTNLGASDSFLAGFIWGVLSNCSLLDSLRMGTIIASMAMRNKYVQLFKADRHQIERKFLASFHIVPSCLTT
jgi:sugar/nucleoside kinase (ribokinase family)